MTNRTDYADQARGTSGAAAGYRALPGGRPWGDERIILQKPELMDALRVIQ